MTTLPKAAAGIVGFDPEQNRAAVMLLADLRCPEHNGVIIDPEIVGAIEIFKTVIVPHLVLEGWRVDLSKRKRKARRVYGSGVVDGAVVWVPIDAPDDPLANVMGMTFAEIEALEPEDLRNEARRRVGLPVPAPAPPEGWHTTTKVTITDQPDEEQL